MNERELRHNIKNFQFATKFLLSSIIEDIENNEFNTEETHKILKAIIKSMDSLKEHINK